MRIDYRNKLWLVMLAILLVEISSTSISFSDSQETQEEPSLCPVVFGEIPEKVPDQSLESTPLLAPGYEEIPLLHPQELGLFVVSVDNPGSAPIYASYKLKSPRTKDYLLSLGLRGVHWRTAAITSDTEALETEILPGHYRVVLQYLASHQDTRRQRTRTVCLAISPSFELTRTIYSLRFK